MKFTLWHIVGFILLCLALSVDFDGELPKESQNFYQTSVDR